jgi:hypothetical protein
MGPSCSFAHGQEELRSTQEFFKTTICLAFQRGDCNQGACCRFAHGEHELRRTAVFNQVKQKHQSAFVKNNAPTAQAGQNVNGPLRNSTNSLNVT